MSGRAICVPEPVRQRALVRGAEGRRWLDGLGRLTGVGYRGIWEWGFVERVSTGLLVTRVGADLLGREMLDVAEAWAAA